MVPVQVGGGSKKPFGASISCLCLALNVKVFEWNNKLFKAQKVVFPFPRAKGIFTFGPKDEKAHENLCPNRNLCGSLADEVWAGITFFHREKFIFHHFSNPNDTVVLISFRELTRDSPNLMTRISGRGH